jgi:hypothetical protein
MRLTFPNRPAKKGTCGEHFGLEDFRSCDSAMLKIDVEVSAGLCQQFYIAALFKYTSECNELTE